VNSKKNNKIPSTRDTAPKKEPVKKFNFSALNKVKSKKKKLLSSKAYQEQILAGDTNF